MNMIMFDAPGTKAKRRIAVANVAGILILAAVLLWVVTGLAGKGQFAAAKWTPFLDPSMWQNFLLPGLWATLKAAAFAVVFSAILGIVLGLGRSVQNPLIRWAATIFVELFRAIPVLIMMLFGYAVLASSGLIDSSNAPFLAVVIGLTLYNSSVIAELVRGGIANLPKGQREAALAIGLTPGRSMLNIELPQAMIAMLPSFVSQLIIILKDTGLGYLVNYPELLRQARLLGSTEANLLPAMMVAALMFVVLNNLLALAARRLSQRSVKRAAGRLVAAETVEQFE
jgi:glutamate transport system permease protein